MTLENVRRHLVRICVRCFDELDRMATERPEGLLHSSMWHDARESVRRDGSGDDGDFRRGEARGQTNQDALVIDTNSNTR